ncbi:methyltransferase, partial [Pseudomonas aeruginosa]
RPIHLLFSLVTHFRNPRSTQTLYFALLARSARNTAEHPGSFGTLRKNTLIPRISAPWISLRKQPWNFPTACSRAFSCVPKE